MNIALSTAIVRALMPVIGGILVAFGIKVSPAMLQLVTDNLVLVLLGLGGLGAAFPSIKAAIKYREAAE